MFYWAGRVVFWLLQDERDGGADELEGLPLGAGRLGEDRDGDLGAGEPDLVAGQGGQVLQQGAEAAAGPLKERHARETRQAILAAAHELFLAQGYGATTVDQIAAKAGVSKPTVFASVGNKQAVLAAVRDVALAGDDLPVAVADRPAFQAVLAEPDPRRAVALMADHLADLWSRYAPIADILHGAASSGEPALQELWDTSQQQRLTAARSFITALADKGSLRDGLDHDTASDIAWLHMAPDN